MPLSEKDKMMSGQPYTASDSELTSEREHARNLLQSLNKSYNLDPSRLQKIYKKLFSKVGDSVLIQPPFFCDYGYNITLGDNVYMNYNCIILDVCKISIGHRTMFGPNVQIYAATHPMDAKIRRTGLESGAPVTIGEDVWVGGGAVICPGITIGDRTVIGAGSVVTRDLPSDVFAAGNPCRVIRKLE